ncbi:MULTISPECIES: LysM peptidoglycan-binding domain-containing protein [unclassified Geodermatophilus]|uniref:LysM peptidoglycan-binding domain-containing protein n=1 Tax=unclassified Geodermatophilus TaxID=2637632 RepID=UPI003EEA5747
MSTRRLLGTTVVMAATAVALRAVTPDLSWLADSGPDLQRAADTVGPETLLVAGVAAFAWATWLWGLLGLVLTALSALPGLAGVLARAVSRRLLPAGARRAAAVALGVGLAVGAPALAGGTPGLPTVELTTVSAEGTLSTGAAVVDWPAPAATGPVPDRPTPAASDPVPDWPAPAPGDHVVLRGDCLWDIAAADLRGRSGREPTDGDIATAVRAWWQANADVVGPDPDLLLPGQVLRPPSVP